jgi:energy-coupling factor transport system ATP-binding protein
MEEAVLADRVVVLENGRILLQGPPREVFSDIERLRQVGLDVPQPAELCHQLRRAGVPLPKDVLTAEECVEALSLLLEESYAGN